MSFSSRRRNYLLTPHRRDGLIEWMKSMLQHSFVLDALEATADDTFRHFEILINEHREFERKQLELASLMSSSTSISSMPSSSSTNNAMPQISRLKQLVPTIGSFHTPLPLREAFKVYNEKHMLTKRKHITISFNELRHILNLAQIMALRRHNKPEAGAGLGEDDDDDNDDEYPGGNGQRQELSSMDDLTAYAEELQRDDVAAAGLSIGQQLNGPRMITFDGDQTLYSDGANFDSNPRLAFYLYQLLRHQVAVAVVTAAGYDYNVAKYEYRLSGLLHYFSKRGLTDEECGRFYLFGGECNYLCQLGPDYKLHPVREYGPGGWMTSTRYLPESPGNWPDSSVQALLDVCETSFRSSVEELHLRGRIVRKKRSVGLIPSDGRVLTRESLDEAVLRVHEKLHQMNGGIGAGLPYCAFNGGSDAWVDVGNKRVGVQVLQAYLGIEKTETLHIGDQFLNTGNDYAARDVSPCVWIINPEETTYVLKSILRFAGVALGVPDNHSASTSREEEDEETLVVAETSNTPGVKDEQEYGGDGKPSSKINFEEIERRRKSSEKMDVYTGEMLSRPST